MRIKKKEYFVFLILFLMFVFGSNINNFLIWVDPKLNNENIIKGYNEELKKEYDELLKYNSIDYDSNLDLTVSKVKYRDVYNHSNTLTIYKGFKDGINVGDAVLTNDGLVGVIDKTYEHSSVVLLITSKDSGISVAVNDAYGILKFSDNKLIVSEISNYYNIKEGDLIYTSGLGNLPVGIYVGKVKSVSLNKTEIEKVIEVEMGLNIDKVNYLFIRGIK